MRPTPTPAASFSSSTPVPPSLPESQYGNGRLCSIRHYSDSSSQNHSSSRTLLPPLSPTLYSRFACFSLCTPCRLYRRNWCARTRGRLHLWCKTLWILANESLLKTENSIVDTGDWVDSRYFVKIYIALRAWISQWLHTYEVRLDWIISDLKNNGKWIAVILKTLEDLIKRIHTFYNEFFNQRSVKLWLSYFVGKKKSVW